MESPERERERDREGERERQLSTPVSKTQRGQARSEAAGKRHLDGSVSVEPAGAAKEGSEGSTLPFHFTRLSVERREGQCSWPAWRVVGTVGRYAYVSVMETHVFNACGEE